MSDISLLSCPNCGSTEFTETTPDVHRCDYCGTILRSPQERPETRVVVICPRCGSENPRGTRYCSECGQSLTDWLPREVKQLDPATLSILVTILGWFFLPVISAVIGLILAYRARKQARTTYGRSGSERLARTAIIIGWVGIGIGLVPLILTLAVAGFSWGFTLCNGPIEAWSY